MTYNMVLGSTVSSQAADGLFVCVCLCLLNLCVGLCFCLLVHLGVSLLLFGCVVRPVLCYVVLFGFLAGVLSVA